MTKISELHEKWSQDSEYKDAYDKLGEEFLLASSIISARENAGLTQEELAELMDAKQSLIARLESGGQRNTTIKTLYRIAEATNTQLRISFDQMQ